MDRRFRVLDGWRGISILFVLAAHLFPLGLNHWSVNEAAGAAGMALFFTLSGFLITTSLLRDQNITKFLVRRLMRIVPLAWLVIAITFLVTEASLHEWLSNLFFYANWPPMGIREPITHFWSLCVEMQFYVGVAVLVLMLGRKGLWLLPVLCLLVTFNRFNDDVLRAINTYYRLDEILVGCVLAQIYHADDGRLRAFLGRLNPLLIVPVLVLSGAPETGALNYFRPYIALALVGSTLFAQKERWWHPWLEGRVLFYVASVSYALYIIHGGLRYTWLGEGETLEKYLKRPLLLLVTFALAHVSTRYYEAFFITLGKRWTSGLSSPRRELGTTAAVTQNKD